MFLCCAAVQLSPIQKQKVDAGIFCPNLQHAYSHSELYEKSGIGIQPEHYKKYVSYFTPSCSLLSPAQVY